MRPQSRLSKTDTTGTYFYTHDGLGSVRQLLDSSETIQNDYDYNAFGEGVSQTELVTNEFKYTGRRFDPESGIYYYRARYYDSAIGRFLQLDIPTTLLRQLYSYVLNNPVNWVDPSGRQLYFPDPYVITPDECCDQQDDIRKRMADIEAILAAVRLPGGRQRRVGAEVNCYPWGPGTPQQKLSSGSSCVDKCMMFHERVHEAQCLPFSLFSMILLADVLLLVAMTMLFGFLSFAFAIAIAVIAVLAYMVFAFFVIIMLENSWEHQAYRAELACLESGLAK